MTINTATTTYKQYEPCDHRKGSVMLGTFREFYDTPCPTCVQLEASTKRGTRVAALLLLLAFLTYLAA